jgi:segregation and condensation protein B
MEPERLNAILESLLFAAGEPVPMARLQAVLESVPREAIRKALGELALSYANGSHGIVLEEVAGGYQLRTAREYAYYVRKLLAAKPPRLSRPLLETLAIVAYRQPITRPEIEQLRGVDSEGVLDTLLERRLVRIAGRKEAPGRPIVYATTPEFLEVFGLKDLASLPDLEEFRALQPSAESATLADPATMEAPATTDQPVPESSGAEDSALLEPPAPDPPDEGSSHD